MPDPQQNPTDPRPDQAPATPQSQPQTEQNQQVDPAKSTQENMGDGAGIRGDYGDASQTNGMEGGPDEPRTDTELTGS